MQEGREARGEAKRVAGVEEEEGQFNISAPSCTLPHPPFRPSLAPSSCPSPPSSLPHLQLPLQPLAPHSAQRLSALEEAEGASGPTLHGCLDDVSDELSQLPGTFWGMRRRSAGSRGERGAGGGRGEERRGDKGTGTVSGWKQNREKCKQALCPLASVMRYERSVNALQRKVVLHDGCGREHKSDHTAREGEKQGTWSDEEARREGGVEWVSGWKSASGGRRKEHMWLAPCACCCCCCWGDGGLVLGADVDDLDDVEE